MARTAARAVAHAPPCAACSGPACDPLPVDRLRVLRLVRGFAVRPELAELLAPAIFGEAGRG